MFCTFILILFGLFYQYDAFYWKKRGFPQINPVPIFGNTWKWAFFRSPHPKLMQSIYNYFPNERVCGFYKFRQPCLMIRDPDVIKQICIKYFEKFSDHLSTIDDSVDFLWANNLFALRGAKWKAMRVMLSPVFTGNKLKGIFEIVANCAQNFVSNLDENEEPLIKVELKDFSTRFATDVIGTTAFGINNDSLKDQTNKFYEMGTKVTDFHSVLKNWKFFMAMIYSKFAKIISTGVIDPDVAFFFKKIVQEGIRHRLDNPGYVRHDLIHFLLDAKRNAEEKAKEANAQSPEKNPEKFTIEINEEVIAAQAVIFFLAGYQNISVTSCFMAYELATNPDIQVKVMQEIDSHLANNQSLTYDVLDQLKYLEMVVLETLRKWPPNDYLDRVCTEDFVLYSENKKDKPIVMKKGDIIEIPVYSIHYDPKYFENPNKFDPERFSNENKAKRHSSTYLPFGLGPRFCIGQRFALMEIKLFFAHLLSRFEIVPIKESQIPPKLCRKSFVLFGEGEFWFGLKKRRYAA